MRSAPGLVEDLASHGYIAAIPANREGDTLFVLNTLAVRNNGGNDSTWASFWAHTTGPKLDLQLANSQHATFSDNEQLLPQIAQVTGITPEQLAALIGTIDPNTDVTFVP